MTWKKVIGALVLWFTSFAMSNALVHAMMASFARLSDVPDLYKWLEHHKPHRYALSLLVAYMVQLMCRHVRIITLRMHWWVRQTLKRDFVIGYRLGAAWFLIMFLGLFLAHDRIVVNPGWIGPGLMTFWTIGTMIIIEHFVFRVWIYENLKFEVTRNQARIFVSLLWLGQRAFFFHLSHPLPVFALFIEGWAALVLVDLLGSLGSLSFLLIWGLSVHCLFSFPFLNFEMPGLVFMEFLESRFLDHIMGAYGDFESQWVIRQSALAITSLAIVLGATFIFGTWSRWRRERRSAKVIVT